MSDKMIDYGSVYEAILADNRQMKARIATLSAACDELQMQLSSEKNNSEYTEQLYEEALAQLAQAGQWQPVPDGEYMQDDPNGPIVIVGNGDTVACPVIWRDDEAVLLEPGMAVCKRVAAPAVTGVPQEIAAIFEEALNTMWSVALLAEDAAKQAQAIKAGLWLKQGGSDGK